MKKLTYILALISLFLGCNRSEKTKKTDEEKRIANHLDKSKNNVDIPSLKKDTLYTYWPLIFDTLSFKRRIIIDNKERVLLVKKYSLNDSSIVNVGIGDKNVFIDFSHANVVDLEMIFDTTKIEKRISKRDFTNSFNTDDSKKMNLMSVGVDSISNEIIHFTSTIGIPDTDIIWDVKYSIGVMNGVLDSLKVKQTTYIGM